MTLIDEFMRKCLVIRVALRINSFVRYRDDGRLDAHQRGSGAHSIRQRCGDDGQDRTRLVRKTRSKDAHIAPGSSWENGYCESFNGKLRDECLNGEIFYSLKEATVVIEQRRKHFNTIRPYSSLSNRPPAPQTSAPKPLRLDRSAAMP
jgi:transposase InsO family protein